jgi:nucleoside-diphosphate-sugar epimerase
MPIRRLQDKGSESSNYITYYLLFEVIMVSNCLGCSEVSSGGNMRVFVTGATGYIGYAVSKALLARGHKVVGLTRSSAGVKRLLELGAESAVGDLTDHASLINAIRSSKPDAVISTASAGMGGGTAKTFSQDRDAVKAMLSALGPSDRPMIFTSGSAVFGTFSDGDLSSTVYDEDAVMPLPAEVFAPANANVHPMIVEGFGVAMAARVETENAILDAVGVRGIVVRPGLVYGHGGSYDVPALIAMARSRGCGPYLGAGATSQSYIHIDDLANLYCLAVERAPKATVLHGVIDEISMRDLATSVSYLIGAEGRTESLTLNQMMGMNATASAAMAAIKHLPQSWLRYLQSASPQPPGAASGISASLNKRLSSEKTKRLLDWSPTRNDILVDVANGSYASKRDFVLLTH